MILPYTAITLLVLVTLYSAFVSFSEQNQRTPGWMFPETTSRSVRRVIGVLTLAILFGSGAWIASTVKNSPHRSSRFLIPEGYVGWIRIEFEVQGAPPLPIENDQYVLKIAANGMLRTSSSEQYGWANDHYFYYSAENVRAIPDSGQSAMIWGKINGEAFGSSGKRKYEEFFVGANQQFKDQPK